MNRDEFEQRGPWYAGISAGQWLVLAIASAGWVFDVYEAQLFTIFKTPMLKELLGGSNPDLEWHAYVAFALFWSAARWGPGIRILGDRIGRVRVMSLTILSYSVFSALTFFARTVWQVDALRFLVALGTGGEWAIAAAWCRRRSRSAPGERLGIFHASSVLGWRWRRGRGWC